MEISKETQALIDKYKNDTELLEEFFDSVMSEFLALDTFTIAKKMETITHVYLTESTENHKNIDFNQAVQGILSPLKFYIINKNMPGYLPETEPAIFINKESALEYLKADISDYFCQDMDEDSDTSDIDAVVDSLTLEKIQGTFELNVRDMCFFIEEQSFPLYSSQNEPDVAPGT